MVELYTDYLRIDRLMPVVLASGQHMLRANRSACATFQESIDQSEPKTWQRWLFTTTCNAVIDTGQRRYHTGLICFNRPRKCSNYSEHD